MRYYLRSVYSSRVLLLVGLDALCLMLASWIAWGMVGPDLSANGYVGVTVGGAFLTFLALFFCDAYRMPVIADGRRTFWAITTSMGIVFAAGISFWHALNVPEGMAACLAYIATFHLPLLLIERAAFRTVGGLPRVSRRILILGTSSLGGEIAQVMSLQKGVGLELVGFLSDELDYAHPEATFAECSVIGKIHHLEKVIDATRIDHIVVASTARGDHFPAEALQMTKMSGCRVESGISFLERISGRIYLRDLHPGYLILSEGFRTGPLASAIKRGIDVVGSSVAMVLVAPVMGLCAAAIKLESKGPALFRQVRCGLGNERFVMYKLRSMRVDAEMETGAVFAAHGDVRITRVGRFIRRTRLDELPQLYNVLRGDMSLVGPRAERPEFIEELSARYAYFRLRSSVKPGLTGWAQTRYGYVSNVDAYEDKLAFDFYYLKNRSLAMDLLILWQTVKTVLLARGL